MDIISLCNRIIKYSFYLLFILVPLILTPWNYELFEFNKMIVTYALTIIIVTAWVVRMAREGKIQVRRTILDIPLLLFVFSQLVSSLFSMDPHVSWFGYYSRFNGGMISVISYAALYFAFTSNSSVFKSLHPLFYSALTTGVLVSIYGVLERMGIDKHIWVQDVQNRVFSTLGQPNWLAAYLVAIMPLALFFASKKRSLQTILFGSVYILFFVTLLFTRSRSGLAGLGAALAIYVIGTKKQMLVPFLALNAILFGIVFFNGTNIDVIDNYVTYRAIQSRLAPAAPQTPSPSDTKEAPSGTLLEYGGTESGTIRKYVWAGAITAWRATAKTFFIGTGTETFAFAFFEHKPIAHNLTSEWDFLYNKAHNEYLNYLTTTGIFGLGTYLLIITVFTVWFIRSSPSPLQIALFSGWVSLLVTNFFGFSVVIIQLFFILFPAAIIALRSKDAPRASHTLTLTPRLGQIVSLVAIVVGIVSLAYVAIMWTGDYFFASGYRLSRAGKLADAYASLTQATFFRPREPLYYDELSVVLGSLSVASLEAGNATAASQLAKQSLVASDTSLSISPNNVNFWKSRTKIYFGFSSLDTKFIEAAKASLEKGATLSPNDPKITYNVAVLEGRLGNNDRAIEILKKTISLKPNYRDAYFALNIFYQETKQPDLAKAILAEYLQKVDPNDKEFSDRVKE